MMFKAFTPHSWIAGGRRAAALLTAALVCAACDSHGMFEPPDGRNARAEAVTTTALHGTVGMEVTPPPTVRVVDGAGRPVPGVSLFFILSNSGTLENERTVTDGEGMATVGKWTLGPLAGAQRVSVRMGGRELTFTATAVPGPVARLIAVDGEDQVAQPGERLLQGLRVRVEDDFGNSISGAPVTFAVLSGEGSIAGDAMTTGAQGIAESGRWTLGPGTGLQQARAQSGSAELDFSATACDSCGALLFNRGDTIFRKNGDAKEIALTTGWSAAWSADGQRIAFTRAEGLFVMDHDGANVKPLLAGHYGSPSFSPDGNMLAVAAVEAPFWPWESDVSVRVLRIDAPVTSLVRLAEYASEPAWSPDGSRIAYAAIGGGLLLMNADGSGVVSLGGPGYVRTPSWSPDGKKIAYASCPPPPEGCHVHVMDVATAVSTRLTQVGGGLHPTWSPDGDRIAFHVVEWAWEDSYQGSIQVIAANGSGDAVTLVADGDSPTWRPAPR